MNCYTYINFFKVSGETSRTTDDSPRRILRSRRNMLHRSNTISIYPNNTNSNSTTPNETSQQISPIATPLIEMGFSARLVQRAIDALGMLL